jgi:hypothetical protein
MLRSKESFGRAPEPMRVIGESTLCLLRSRDGRLVPMVEGRHLKGVGYVSIQAGPEGALVQLSLPAGAVYFETEPDLGREGLN